MTNWKMDDSWFVGMTFLKCLLLTKIAWAFDVELAVLLR